MKFIEKFKKPEEEKVKEDPFAGCLKVKMPGSDKFVLVGKNQILKKHSDEVGARLLVIVDEVAELVTPSGVKTEASQHEDEMRQEIQVILQSLTQLGRSGGVHCLLATQRNDAPIAYDQKLEVERDGKKIQIVWEELEIGDKFSCGSVCQEVGRWFDASTCKVSCGSSSLEVDEDHVFYVNVLEDGKDVTLDLELERSHSVRMALNEYDKHWICTSDLSDLVKKYDVMSQGKKIESVEHARFGVKVRCIMTDTGYYVIDDFKSHNTLISGIIKNNSLALGTQVIVED